MKRISFSALAALALLAGPRTAAAVTYGYTVPSCTSVQFYANGVAWADLHYIVNGGGQMNVRMAESGTAASYTVSGLTSGASVRYFFTYVPSGSSAATDTAWTTMTVGCGGSGNGGTSPGDACTACMYHTLKWSDEFNGTGQPSSADWAYHVGNGYNPGLPGFQGWGNGEWEWYRPEQSYEQNGNLIIRADYFSNPTSIAGSNWYQRSGRITTQGKHSWKYARVEARIAMPAKTATWPAFWMMGAAYNGTATSSPTAPITSYDTMATNWPSCGEIDIMEHKNADTVTYQNLFWDTRIGLQPWASGNVANNPGTYTVGDVTQFHTYALEWDASNMYWYVDNVRVKSQSVSADSQEEFRQEFFVILNLAIAGGFPGTTPVQGDFPLYMYVDYVRVYQAADSGGSGGGSGTGGGTGGTTPCANPITMTTGQSGNFNTTGPVCLRTAKAISGWGCSSFAGRTVSVDQVAVSCGQVPLPAAWSDGYTYFSVTAGTYPWASLYYW